MRCRIALWNQKLTRFVQQFPERHADVVAEIYDVASLFHEVLDNPTKYTFENQISSDNTVDYIWYDALHPSTAMQDIIASDIARFLKRGTEEITKSSHTKTSQNFKFESVGLGGS